MKKNLLFPALLLVLLCTACGHRGRDLPPPDLTGIWMMDGWEKSSYYQFALIDGDEILVYWYRPEERDRDLYWVGTYTPPVNGEEPYKWTSQTRRDQHQDANRFTLVDEDKTFLYKGGSLVYDVMMSHMKMSVSMSPVEDFDAMAEQGALPRFQEIDDLAYRIGVSTQEPEESSPVVTPMPSLSTQPVEPAATPAPYTPPEAPPNQLP